MSGIAGIIRFDGGPVEPGQVEAMTGAMAHRGPDGIAHWQGAGVALGHCQMCTTPESLEETQPLTNEDASLVLVMDGRVDNWEELRQLLLDQGARLRTRADAELVLRAYEVWGRDCLERIDGDFAFVIWDAREREAFCVRDRNGIRPFYFHLTDDRLAFASQMDALLALPGVPQDLNDGIVAEIILDREMSLTETLWVGIERLVPANWMAIASGRKATGRYWSPEDLPEIRYTRNEEYAEHLRVLMVDAVRRRSRSQKGIACEVSGGLDSSMIFGIAAELRRGGEWRAPELAGYCLRFDKGTGADEIEFSRSMARHTGLAVDEVRATHLPLDWYRDWANTKRSFPVHPNGMMSLDLYRTCVSRDQRVVLTGAGGDEWCYGSPYYYADFLQHLRLGAFARVFWSDARYSGLRQAVFSALRFGIHPLLSKRLQLSAKRAFRWFVPVPPEDSRYAMTPHMEKAFSERFESYQRGVFHPRKARHYDALYCLNDPKRISGFEKRDEITNEIGIEHRHPYADRNIIEYCFRTPEWTRRVGNRFRISQRASSEKYMPIEVRNRVTKAEFSTVIIKYLEEIGSYRSNVVDRNSEEWVKKGEFSAMLQLARESAGYGRAKWSAWALFGCALLAESIDHRQ